jgi:hypothetical protein
MLKILLPTTLPIARSLSPFHVAIIDVISSGSEVPIATIVRPMTSSLTPKILAMPEDALTNQLEL